MWCAARSRWQSSRSWGEQGRAWGLCPRHRGRGRGRGSAAAAAAPQGMPPPRPAPRRRSCPPLWRSADEVVASADGEGLPERVRELTGGAGAYAAIECVGGDLFGKVASAVRPGGTAIIYGAMSGLTASFRCGGGQPSSACCRLRACTARARRRGRVAQARQGCFTAPWTARLMRGPGRQVCSFSWQAAPGAHLHPYQPLLSQHQVHDAAIGQLLQ